jgi:hypothetical protein
MPRWTSQLDRSAVTPPENADWGAVASLLWTERDALETLLYRLVQERLLLAAGETRWLYRADAEVADVVAMLQGAEVLRAAELDELILEWGLPYDTTLFQLTELAPSPWDQVLADHRLVLRALMTEVQAATAEVRALLNAGANAIRETLDLLTLTTTTYTAAGSASEHSFGGLLLDAQA